VREPSSSCGRRECARHLRWLPSELSLMAVGFSSLIVLRSKPSDQVSRRRTGCWACPLRRTPAIRATGSRSGAGRYLRRCWSRKSASTVSSAVATPERYRTVRRTRDRVLGSGSEVAVEPFQLCRIRSRVATQPCPERLCTAFSIEDTGEVNTPSCSTGSRQHYLRCWTPGMVPASPMTTSQ
jgi:hypothetical protein